MGQSVMRRTRVKICGITSSSDASEAVRAGADAVGVVLAESPRRVDIDEAREIFAAVPPPVARVGVFVDAPKELVDEAIERLSLSAVQFHGNEPPGDCDAVAVPVIRVLKVGTRFDYTEAEPFRGHVAALLLDTDSTREAGGTGETFAWRLVADVPDWAPVIVAGGLDPTNVGAAIRTLRPFAVDVSSGVEERPRHKDRHKLHAFTAAVHAADDEIGS
jgi:phosphoribosylanthranilate isomerase